jgi:hypothetical protein
MADQVLDQLDRIEDAADQTLAQSEARKKDLLKANDDRMADFDKETDASSEKQIAEMRASLQKKYEESVKKLSAENDTILSRLEQRYKSREDDIADEIVKKMLL